MQRSDQQGLNEEAKVLFDPGLVQDVHVGEFVPLMGKLQKLVKEVENKGDLVTGAIAEFLEGREGLHGLNQIVQREKDAIERQGVHFAHHRADNLVEVVIVDHHGHARLHAFHQLLLEHNDVRFRLR